MNDKLALLGEGKTVPQALNVSYSQKSVVSRGRSPSRHDSSFQQYNDNPVASKRSNKREPSPFKPKLKSSGTAQRSGPRSNLIKSQD